jgi:hypothetical protein
MVLAPEERNVASVSRFSGAKRLSKTRRAINISPVRQKKLGVSDWVEVLVGKGLTNHRTECRSRKGGGVVAERNGTSGVFAGQVVTREHVRLRIVTPV